ncbi:hypothetical protein CONPUDRAFT_156053 [Coniophora puteana RWD-64-598 SS2]|uniref:Glycoside hydrolase family 131 protein n=1 Tax=Coniophora puteana (strain RWD-64-598) TaxID=741705 RepID=A0A5M3MK33_CONPW|nr:uncharacterized protein CONPUDRAFT_156053 [Coniophora puteana RWD-64-598 SS2]EIW79377.1 hypothetical protein CONPUDRAFT_156053 [Coniophora puteana RWD-64-598 SS2]
MQLLRAPAILLALFALLANAVAVSYRGLTNAERLARGLPIAKPQFGRNLPGRAPTPASGAKRSQSASPSPSASSSSSSWGSYSKSLYGRIEVLTSSGTHLGFLSSFTNGTVGVNYGTDSESSDLSVSFTTKANGKDRFDVLINNAGVSQTYLGATSNATLDSGSPSYVSFGVDFNHTTAELTDSILHRFAEFGLVSQQTPVYSPPLASGNQTAESKIWSYTSGSKQIKANYVNPDSSVPTTLIGYSSHSNSLVFVGDIDAYNNASSSADNSLTSVEFYLY